MNKNFSQADFVSLKEYIESRLEGQRNYFESRITSLTASIEQARVGMEKRLDGMNEFRDSLKDQASKFPSKAEIRAELDAMKSDIKELNRYKDSVSGKASQSEMDRTSLIAFIATVIAVISLLLKLIEYIG